MIRSRCRHTHTHSPAHLSTYNLLHLFQLLRPFESVCRLPGQVVTQGAVTLLRVAVPSVDTWWISYRTNDASSLDSYLPSGEPTLPTTHSFMQPPMAR